MGGSRSFVHLEKVTGLMAISTFPKGMGNSVVESFRKPNRPGKADGRMYKVKPRFYLVPVLVQSSAIYKRAG
jgi:hypothetical protein